MARHIAVIALATIVAASTIDDVQLPQAPIVAAAPVLVPPTVDILPKPVARQIPVAQEAEELAQLQMQQRGSQPEGCSLSGQVKLCVNHAAMQRATCVSDDLDCQCTWASVTTTCFAPCIADKESSDGMHVAKGDQEAICSQAAKFGKIAKDKERQKLEEKNNKGKKKKEDVRTGLPKNIDDMNNTPEATAALGQPRDDARHNGPRDGSPDAADDQQKNQSNARKGGSSGDVRQVSNLDSAAPARSASGSALGLGLGLALGLTYAIPSLF
ncbi:hypothetical protein FB645_002903 [Coemansia sp. IMI 203386]|nr:hypothetical protein FB645_002903 [Coemansia sp. IMI 203386]